mgnify:CR=1 FL=1
MPINRFPNCVSSDSDKLTVFFPSTCIYTSLWENSNFLCKSEKEYTTELQNIKFSSKVAESKKDSVVGKVRKLKDEVEKADILFGWRNIP